MLTVPEHEKQQNKTVIIFIIFKLWNFFTIFIDNVTVLSTKQWKSLYLLVNIFFVRNSKNFSSLNNRINKKNRLTMCLYKWLYGLLGFFFRINHKLFLLKIIFLICHKRNEIFLFICIYAIVIIKSLNQCRYGFKIF